MICSALLLVLGMVFTETFYCHVFSTLETREIYVNVKHGYSHTANDV